MPTSVKYSKPKANSYGVPVYHSKCGRVQIAKITPKGQGYNEFVPVVGKQVLPRYYKLGDAKKAVIAALDGNPLPEPGKRPSSKFDYEVVEDKEAAKQAQQRTYDWFRKRAGYQNSAYVPPGDVPFTPPVIPRHDSPYIVLGLGEDATFTEVKSAFRKLTQQHHPDKPTGDAEKFRKIKAAYDAIVAQEKVSV